MPPDDARAAYSILVPAAADAAAPHDWASTAQPTHRSTLSELPYMRGRLLTAVAGCRPLQHNLRSCHCGFAAEQTLDFFLNFSPVGAGRQREARGEVGQHQQQVRDPGLGAGGAAKGEEGAAAADQQRQRRHHLHRRRVILHK